MTDQRLPTTVDTVKSGDSSRPITGIVTTFLATSAVIERAAALGANLVIPHEPVFYNHLDDTSWLSDDPVYQAKRRLLDAHGIVVWRLHDHIHLRRPDGILAGVLQDLGWEAYVRPDPPFLCVIPPMSLRALAGLLKQRLGAPGLRVIGDPEMECRRVGLRVGAPGGQAQITTLSRYDLDVLVCGEINEWETSIYVRDASAAGKRVALVVAGHAASEEAGMRWLADLLHEHFPAIPVTHVPAGDPVWTVEG
jgi:putative NIF3 family GTP cyclohydrolase 1 type 2